MTKLGKETISLLQPIIEAIDSELEKEQDERKDFIIETSDANALKNRLVTYKGTYRKDWNGRFWMTKKGNTLEVSFGPAKRVHFTLNKGPETTDGFSIKRADVGSLEAPPLEMSDTQVVQHILMESPLTANFYIPSLDPDTRNYLMSPSTSPRTALINLLERRGYKYTALSNNHLRVTRN